jgi:hypothetical protein
LDGKFWYTSWSFGIFCILLGFIATLV